MREPLNLLKLSRIVSLDLYVLERIIPTSHLLVMVLTNDTEPVWDKPVDVPEKWIDFVDDNVLASKLASSMTRNY